MKYFAAVALVALVAVAALTEAKPTGVETGSAGSPEAARNKRGLLLGAAYTAPLAYSASSAVAYTAPAVYSAYGYPYAYYSSYPYYAYAPSAPYYLA